jgi:hypothetical protein
MAREIISPINFLFLNISITLMQTKTPLKRQSIDTLLKKAMQTDSFPQSLIDRTKLY